MKNKDGIVLKVDQVWSDSDDEKLRIVGFYGTMPVIRNSVDGSFDTESADDASAFVTLLRSYEGVDLEQAREEGWKVWVDGMEKPDPKNIEIIRNFTCGEWCEFDLGLVAWKGTYSYKLKARPQEPEQIEWKIERGPLCSQVFDSLTVSVGVTKIENTIKLRDQRCYYNLIGYRYAESDAISCIGPNAWWEKGQSRSCIADIANYNDNHYPVFATHAVYQKVNK